jgi:long-chain-fatty-acid--[acyl-carrier-protein] ligase
MEEKWANGLLRFAGLLLDRRYRVQWRGLENVEGKGACLLLANHPAEIDPLILLVKLWPSLRMRTVISDRFTRLPVIGTYTKALKVIPIPDLLLDDSADSQKGVQDALQAIVQAIGDGDSVLLYPSGRLMREGLERVGGSAAAFEVCQKIPKATICLVRTRGLYGSLSSAAPYQGATPSVLVGLLKGAAILLRYAVFFAPKRDVTVDIAPLSEELRHAKSKQEFNQALDAYYNEGGAEQASSNITFLRPDFSAKAKSSKEIDLSRLDPSTSQAIREKLGEIGSVKAEDIEASMSLRDELFLDSLQIVELRHWISEQFGRRAPSVRRLTTVAEVYKAVLK